MIRTVRSAFCGNILPRARASSRGLRFSLVAPLLFALGLPPAFALDGEGEGNGALAAAESRKRARTPAAPTRDGRRPVAVAPAPVSSLPRPGDELYREATGQVVYQVLLAELALQRGNVELASKAYADLALRTRDPKVLERTVEVAGYARRLDLALEAARLWIEVEPASARAQQVLAGVMLMSNRLDDLAPQLIRMLELDKESLGSNLLGLNRMLVRNPDRQAVFRLVEKVTAPFFGHAEAHYAVATAAGAAGERTRALAEVRRALELRPDWEMAALLQAQLLARESGTEAIASLQRFIERNPEASEVELHLARALIADKRYGEARQHFDHLLRRHPDKPEVVYPVAILALQQQEFAFAEAQLKHLLTLDFSDKSVASYYLGQIAEEGRRSDEALSWYARVGAGDHYLPARMRSAHLLSALGRLDDARRELRETRATGDQERAQLSVAEAQLLRDARRHQEGFDLLERELVQHPGQPELLYESALLAEKLGRHEVMEARLRKLIELQPASAQAYNALGYSLAERNLRLAEAQALIEKALQLAENDPFILDSMGWVLYRRGDLQGALRHLERAYAQRADPEIAAHLGEVLWMLDRRDEARHTLREAQKKHPGNEILVDALRKFGR